MPEQPDKTKRSGNARLFITSAPSLFDVEDFAVAVLDDGSEVRMRNLGGRVEVRTWDKTSSCNPPPLHVTRIGSHVIDAKPSQAVEEPSSETTALADPPTAHDIVSLQRRLYDGEKHAGWDPRDENTFSEEIAHLHEEVTEAFRAWRLYKDCGIYWTCERCDLTIPYSTDLDTVRHAGSGHHYTGPESEKGKGQDCWGRFKPTGVPIELADTAIGMFYIAERWLFDLFAAIEIKHAYNLDRSYAAEGRRLHEGDAEPVQDKPVDDDLVRAAEAAACSCSAQYRAAFPDRHHSDCRAPAVLTALTIAPAATRATDAA